ncbi:MAG: hypothetical protein IVW54_01305 [Candidatus Binataceae bacterium]|nr:hypothetical protein [Candidatus Binataceae bacterium]
MTLKEQLAAMKAASADRIPPEIQAVMKKGLDDLRATGIAARTLKVGDRAPEFSLPNQDGAMVSSAALLTRGPLGLSFYRGKW